MSNEWLKARQTKYAVYLTTYIAVIVVVLVVANILADRYTKSLDTTSNKRYSLSDQTAKIVKGLKQNATITYFNQSRSFREGKDLLDQYSNLSPKIHVAYVDPDKDPQVAREAGIRNLGTAVVQLGQKKEEAKSMTEEGITGAFIRELKDNTRTVCFVSGSGEHQVDNSDRDGLSRFKELLSKDNYESKTIDLLQKAEVPGDCTVLVVAGPTRNYERPEVDAIKKYVEGGGRALFMLDPPVKLGRSVTADNDELTSVLQSWGVTLDKNLILDLNPIGQLAGLGPQVTIAAAGTYDTGKQNVQGRFAVFGSSTWAANRFINVLGNNDLALNTINWLSSDEDLISIRPKEQDNRRVNMTRAQMNFVSLTSQFLLPLLVVIAGVSVWWKRR